MERLLLLRILIRNIRELILISIPTIVVDGISKHNLINSLGISLVSSSGCFRFPFLLSVKRGFSQKLWRI